MSSEQQTTCPKCQRPFATVEDFRNQTLDGKCPTGYATRDPDAANDCDRWSMLTPYQRSQIEWSHQQVFSLREQLAAVEEKLALADALAKTLQCFDDAWTTRGMSGATDRFHHWKEVQAALTAYQSATSHEREVVKIYILTSDRRTHPQAYASRKHAEYHALMWPGTITEVEVCHTDPLHDVLVALHNFSQLTPK